MKVIIAGSRSFNDYSRLKRVMATVPASEIVCGEAYGADSLGRRYAEENNLPIKSFPAQWNLYGKAAGPIRNKEMAEYGDYLVAFWDGVSRGTKNMIEVMKTYKKHGRVEIF